MTNNYITYSISDYPNEGAVVLNEHKDGYCDGVVNYRRIDENGKMEDGNSYGAFLKTIIEEQGLSREAMDKELQKNAVKVFKDFFGFKPTEAQIKAMMKADILISDDMTNIEETWAQRAFDSLFYNENDVKALVTAVEDSDIDIL